jgi:hypothetical protein
MFDVHIGLPKTGTTSLQRHFFEHAGILEENGCLYPKEWIAPGKFAHHLLSSAVRQGGADNDELLAKFADFLRARENDHVLISSEEFTNCILPKTFKRFSNALSLWATLSTTRLVVALRRFDTFVESTYLHATKVGNRQNDLATYIKNNEKWVANFFAGLASISKMPETVEMVYLRYDRSIDMVKKIANALNLPSVIGDHDGEKRIVNSRLGAKAQAFLLKFDEHKSSRNIKATRQKWIRGFELGRLRFNDEIDTYSILTFEQANSIHESGLKLAKQMNVSAYCEFFGSDRISEKQYIDLRSIEMGTSDWRQVGEMDDALTRHRKQVGPGFRLMS